MPNRTHIIWWWSSIDLLIATTATVVSLQFQSETSMSDSLASLLALRISAKNLVLLSLFLVLWTGVHQLCGLYTTVRPSKRRAMGSSVFVAVAIGSLFYLLFPLFSNAGSARPVLKPVLTFFVVAGLLSLTIRCSVAGRLLVRRAKRVNTLIIGSGPMARRLSESLRADLTTSYQILGFVDSPSGLPTSLSADAPSLLADLVGLERLLMSSQVDEVMIALPLRSCYDAIQSSIAICERVGVPVTYQFQPFTHNVGFFQVLERALEPYISLRPSRIEQSQLIKRSMDVACSAVGLLVLSPLLVAIVIAVRLTSRGPALFVQERYGLNRQCFRMFKFRTMVIDAEARQSALESQNEAQGPVFKIKNDPRVTKLGKFLRKTSLDELPQFLNVLRGEMSLVGPRPLPLRDVSKFSEATQMRRFSVKPGLTCLWQVRGRSNIAFDSWLIYDLEYIDTWSPLLDLQIIARTFKVILSTEGAV